MWGKNNQKIKVTNVVMEDQRRLRSSLGKIRRRHSILKRLRKDYTIKKIKFVRNKDGKVIKKRKGYNGGWREYGRVLVGTDAWCEEDEIPK